MKPLIIVNITPDSFSDGGFYFSVDKFKNYIVDLVDDGFDFFDIGAQSTAPNKAQIDKDEEIKRYENIFFEALKDKYFVEKVKNCWFSIDTYRASTFVSVITEFIKYGFSPERVIWNDVSGVLCDEVFSILKEYQCKYVYCHSELTDRERTPDHFHYIPSIRGTEYIKSIKKYFNSGKSKLEEAGLLNQVIFDPCFGFSKDNNHNLTIIDGINDIFSNEIPVLIGISKKRFIKSIAESVNSSWNEQTLEMVHLSILTRLLAKKHDSMRFILRVHDVQVPKIINEIFSKEELSFQM